MNVPTLHALEYTHAPLSGIFQLNRQLEYQWTEGTNAGSELRPREPG